MTQPIPFAEIRSWMFDAALPLWGTVGIDRTKGGFVEKLDFEGRPLTPGFRRTRVAGRQTYVFSHAAMLGWTPGLELSAFGTDVLDRLYLGEDDGWPRTIDDDGKPLDVTPDLYDLAFVLFAYGWRHRAARDPESLAGAHRALDFIERRMRTSRGYWHEVPPRGPRLQNPHMHLLEACLAVFEASGDQRFLDTAHAIVALFQSALFDGHTLAEYFDGDWRRLQGDQGRLVEPGHQLEWAWILMQYGRLAKKDLSNDAGRLVAFAERYGLDPDSGRVLQVVRDDGVGVDASSRTWPNTERIKGLLAQFEILGTDTRAGVALSSRVLLDQYLSTDVRGLWIDHFDAQGRPMAKDVPASTFYHVFLAFAEVLRLEPQLTAR
jgi:mannose/cellobiose epimerase-like protein (N-acyl-D-glucosamine 2-epimerase family)